MSQVPHSKWFISLKTTKPLQVVVGNPKTTIPRKQEEGNLSKWKHKLHYVYVTCGVKSRISTDDKTKVTCEQCLRIIKDRMNGNT